MHVSEERAQRVTSVGRTLPLALAILGLVLLVGLLSLPVLSTPTPDGPPPRVACVECHDGFVPFAYSIEAPSEVPTDEPFAVHVTVRNEGAHSVEAPTAVLTVTGAEGLAIDSGEPPVQTTRDQGTVGVRSSATHTMAVRAGARSAVFTLDGTGGLLDVLSLTVTGPDGGSWTASGPATDCSVELDAGDIASGGHGDYTVVVGHPRGVRRVDYALTLDVELGTSSAVLVGPELQQGGSHTFEFALRGSLKGPNGIGLVISGTCVHVHSGGSDHDEETFDFEESIDIAVGDEFAYDGGRDGGGGGGWDAALANGRYLGFVSAALLVTAVLTSGHVLGLPRRARVHCWSSYALVPVLLVHWATLWLGPYGSVLGGIWTGLALLACVSLLTVTGARPALLDGRVAGLTSGQLHRYLTYVTLLVLVVHAVTKGSHFAFLRGGA
jgi:hypothetical protein